LHKNTKIFSLLINTRHIIEVFWISKNVNPVFYYLLVVYTLKFPTNLLIASRNGKEELAFRG